MTVSVIKSLVYIWQSVHYVLGPVLWVGRQILLGFPLPIGVNPFKTRGGWTHRVQGFWVRSYRGHRQLAVCAEEKDKLRLPQNWGLGSVCPRTSSSPVGRQKVRWGVGAPRVESKGDGEVCPLILSHRLSLGTAVRRPLGPCPGLSSPTFRWGH